MWVQHLVAYLTGQFNCINFLERYLTSWVAFSTQAEFLKSEVLLGKFPSCIVSLSFPDILVCSSYPAQDQIGGDAKIPTIIYYDQGGNVRAVGAEAVREGIEEDAEDGQWTKAEWQGVTSPSP